jgi:hypothetical protein
MTDLVFPDTGYSRLAAELLRAETESAAVLFANEVAAAHGKKRLLVREVVQAPPEAYRKRTAMAIELSPSFVATVGKRARHQNQSLTFVHTHPFSNQPPAFSPIDDNGEQSLAEFLRGRIPGKAHCALVVSSGGCRARLIGTNEPVRVVQVGRTLRFPSESMDLPVAEARFDRQVRAFGLEGQARLRQLRVGIVGLGGTGTVVAEQLAHLGVGHLLLIDPDVVQESNLNRLVGATATDIGKSKAVVAADYVRSIRRDIETDAVVGSVLRSDVAMRLGDCDLFFGCTDSHGSRAVLSQFAYQYLVPCIDTGVSITAQHGKIIHITGRVQMLAPGLSCLTCAGLLDADAIRHDLMTEYERQADPYFVGAHEPQPAVISLNATVISLAVTMFLAAVTHIPAEARYQIYSGVAGTVRPVTHAPDPHCIVCSYRGALARGGEWPLPARKK